MEWLVASYPSPTSPKPPYPPCLFICKRVTIALPEETFITAATIWFVIAYMPASTVGCTLLPLPPGIRIVPSSTNSSA